MPELTQAEQRELEAYVRQLESPRRYVRGGLEYTQTPMPDDDYRDRQRFGELVRKLMRMKGEHE